MGRGFGIAAAVDNETIKQVARAAEEAGYSSFWVNDTVDADGLDALAAAASVTERIRLGVGVVSVDRRPADTVAAGFKSYGLPADRFWLGIGSADPKGALGKIRSSVETLRADLDCPIIIAALGPRMTALAGEIADGVLFNWLTPDYAAVAAQRVRDAAREAGRETPVIMSYARAGLLPDAEEVIRIQANRYASIPAYAKHFERMGVEAYLTVLQGVNPPVLQAGIAEYEAVLDETVVRALTKDDEPETILELLDACRPGREDE